MARVAEVHLVGGSAWVFDARDAQWLHEHGQYGKAPFGRTPSWGADVENVGRIVGEGPPLVFVKPKSFKAAEWLKFVGGVQDMGTRVL